MEAANFDQISGALTFVYGLLAKILTAVTNDIAVVQLEATDDFIVGHLFGRRQLEEPEDASAPSSKDGDVIGPQLTPTHWKVLPIGSDASAPRADQYRSRSEFLDHRNAAFIASVRPHILSQPHRR